MTTPVTLLVRHWSFGPIALCGATTGSRTPVAANVTCPLCRMEVRCRLDTTRRVVRIIRRAVH